MVNNEEEKKAIEKEWENKDFRNGISYAVSELRDGLNILERKLSNYELTDVEIAKQMVNKLNIDVPQTHKMEKDELHGLIDRIIDETAKEYKREISPHSVKRALGLWKP